MHTVPGVFDTIFPVHGLTVTRYLRSGVEFFHLWDHHSETSQILEHFGVETLGPCSLPGSSGPGLMAPASPALTSLLSTSGGQTAPKLGGREAATRRCVARLCGWTAGRSHLRSSPARGPWLAGTQWETGLPHSSPAWAAQQEEGAGRRCHPGLQTSVITASACCHEPDSLRRGAGESPAASLCRAAKWGAGVGGPAAPPWLAAL